MAVQFVRRVRHRPPLQQADRRVLDEVEPAVYDLNQFAGQRRLPSRACANSVSRR